MNRNENTYRHPSEGQSLPVRFLIASLAIGFLILVCSVPADASPGPTFSRPCRVVAGEADAHDGRLDRIAARHGGIDYIGARGTGLGRWTVNDTGRTFGYSRHEDSRVYSTARCARIAPAYLNSPDFT